MTDLSAYQPYLARIREQEREMVQLTHDWSLINSGSLHPEGLATMLSVLEKHFRMSGGEVERCDLAPMESVDSQGNVTQQPLGQALRIRKRAQAPLQIFLGGHYDTVYGKDHPFQQPEYLDERTLRGPGVADLKGGLVVMLKALEALEASPWAERIGWEVLLNPDEEIGSHGSAPLLKEAAERCHLGLVYEPSLPDGTLVSSRKGSGNFTLVVRGRAAHAGREFEKGRNAIAALAAATTAIFALNGQREGVTINPGKIEGGGALNAVPDLAILRFNVRVPSPEDCTWLEERMEEIISHTSDGITFQLHGGFTRPPKPVSVEMARLQTLIEECGTALEMPIRWQATGGCCDGNNLATYGLPNVDTLGVRGGDIHSANEYVLLDSLTERAELSTLLLLRLASGEVSWVHS